MDKFLLFLEGLDDGSNSELLESVVQGYVLTHPEALNEGFMDTVRGAKEGYQKMAREGTGAIRRGLGAAAIAGGLLAGGAHMANKQSEAGVREMGKEIATFTQAAKQGDRATADKFLNDWRKNGLIYRIDATPGGHRTFVTGLGTFDEDGTLISGE
jgi:hypothetical protein